MNILPKKRWHVRTKANIERVRRDEAKAAEEEKETQRRIQLAEQEARTSFLRDAARKRQLGSSDSSELSVVPVQEEGHVNFFKELEEGKKSWETNKEHEEEKRKEQEKLEQSIGLLTYLGQGSSEYTGQKPWYEQPPKKQKVDDSNAGDEVSMKSKSFLDPLQIFHKYVGNKSGRCPEVITKNVKSENPCIVNYNKVHKDKKDKEKRKSAKHKKKKKHQHNKRRKEKDSFSSSVSVEQLRAERLKREKEEKVKAERLLAKHRGELKEDIPTPIEDGKQTYHSQFNPHIARQSKPT